MTDLYDTDVYAWSRQQADALRRRSANEIDWGNVAEEIESVGNSEARELESRFAVLLQHLLKWRFQPDKRSASWEATIKVQRKMIRRRLAKAPSLKSVRDEAFADAYLEGLAGAVAETGLGLDDFPETSPFTVDEAMDDAFWPDAV